jgi:hypothetical protein
MIVRPLLGKPTMAEMFVSENHSSLLQKGVNYSHYDAMKLGADQNKIIKSLC